VSDPVAYELRAHYELLPPDQPGRGLSIWWTQSGRLVDSIAIYEGGVEGGGYSRPKYLMALEASEKRLIETKIPALWGEPLGACCPYLRRSGRRVGRRDTSGGGRLGRFRTRRR